MPYPDYLWFGKGRGRGSEFSIYFVQDGLYKIFVGILSFTVWTPDDCAFTGLILQCLWYLQLVRCPSRWSDTRCWPRTLEWPRHGQWSLTAAHTSSLTQSRQTPSLVPPNLRFLCPLEFDGNRFQWKPKGILASGNARLVPASSDFLKTGMVRIHTSPPSFSYSKSAVHLISHLDKCLTPPPHVSRYFWKRRFFLSFRKKCVYTWRIRIVFGCPHENGKTIEIRLPPFSCVHTNTISRHFQ